ncbi:hypothetical protein ABZT02_10845 [Streptomyces sp. NPDC005402]|uniref:hypothetical protein n=1 Tax=Streptomyces sp. NPDC005402 TaxID=3155338 RepID=UPI0033B92849
MRSNEPALRVPDAAWDASFTRLSTELPARFAAHHEGYRRIKPAFTPLVVSPDAAREMWDTTRTCLARLRARASRVLADGCGSALDGLGYPPDEASWLASIHTPAALDIAGSFARADFVLGPDGPRLVEINVGPTVGGIGILDRYADVVDDLPGAADLFRSTSPSVRLPRPAGPWGRALRRLADVPAGGPRPRIVLAVTDEEADIPIPHDAAHYLSAQGFDATVARTSDISFDGSRATVGEQRVDLVYGCFTYDEVITPRYRAFVDTALACHARGGPVYVAPPVFSLLGNKAMLAMEDGEQPADGPGGVAATRLVTPAALARARAERERLVLKPAIGYGGRGVVIGRAVSAEVWDERLRAALARPHVLQDYVAPSSLDLPVAGGHAPFEVGIGCLYVDGHFAGFLARGVPAGTGGVANVHQGAFFAPAACESLDGCIPAGLAVSGSEGQ